jgi:hypothetical protein
MAVTTGTYMNLTPTSPHYKRSLVLLAPLGVNPGAPFTDVVGDREVYDTMLAAMQKFRGQVYCLEGNLSLSDLSADGRHVQAVDTESWHLLTLNEQGAIAACGRLVLHREDVGFDDLLVAHTALAHCERWGRLLRWAVEERMLAARRRGIRFAEIGGWAVSRALRCSTEAVRMLVAGFALGLALGGVAGISTANAGNHSAAILRRIGGESLMAGETPIPKFYEPQYRRDLEILYLDSFHPNPRYEAPIQECREALEAVTVISSGQGVRGVAAYAQEFPSTFLAAPSTKPAFVANFLSHPA